MAADMLKARLAATDLRKWQAGAELDDAAVAGIKDLCDTFAWLDESRTGVIKERDELLERVKSLTEHIKTLNAEGHE